MQGGNAAVIAYGQTGAGKTYTTSALQERAAAAISQAAAARGGSVSVAAFECLGDRINDLLAKVRACARARVCARARFVRARVRD